ncbi:hypothetical protein [Nodosilinea sp. P-1105]|uniref:hypothetical protein n=1 Tax=Nodosilinea sp. P-1105 TaxID=2546229 RepID=UPI001F0F2984|nr:hypothetical protein [Nodosilinea sp. P-1105]
MEQAVKGQEFSLMLAGFLVATSAAAMMGVYFLMSNYLLYRNQAFQLESFAIQQPVYTSASLPDRGDFANDWLSQTR